MTLRRAAGKPRYRALIRSDLDRIEQLRWLGPRQREAMKAVSAVLPFRVNGYVLEELIRWEDVPEDPIYQLTFPQPESTPFGAVEWE